jgi:hypothetical protein
MNFPFQPPTGMTSDDTLFEAEARWTNGSWVRFYNDNWQVKGGWERLVLNTLPGICRATHGWSNSAGILTIAFGHHLGLHYWQSGIFADITPAGFVAGQTDGTGGSGYGTGAYGAGVYGAPSLAENFPLTWSLDNYGGDLMANPRGRTIYRWDQNPANKATPLPNAPANVTYMCVNQQRQVMAFGCNEEVSGAFNPLAIRFSDIEDYTAWTTLPSNNAGEVIIESGGRIVCARIMGDYCLVWTQTDLFLGTFLGSPGQTWKFERIGSHCGAISPGAPIVRGQHSVWIAPDRMFWELTLGGEPTPLVCPIRAMFADHVSQGQDDKIVGGTVTTFSEAVWFWPDARDGSECSRALTLSANGWSRDVLARSAFMDTGPALNPVGVAPTGEIYWHEKGNTADGQTLTAFLESSCFYLSEADGGVLVNGLWPDFKGQVGPVNLTLFTRRYPQDYERTKGPWVLQPNQSKRSFRVAGRMVRVRYDFASAPCFARGGKPEFDIQPIGGR